jgi:hypothetical protein
MNIDLKHFDEWMEKLYSKMCEDSKNNKLFANIRDILGENEGLLDNQDLCLMLHVSPRTLQRYRSSGLLPFLKRGQKIYYKASAVKEFVNQTGDYWDKKAFEDKMRTSNL